MRKTFTRLDVQNTHIILTSDAQYAIGGVKIFLDADERLTMELKREITVVLRKPLRVNGFYFKRRFIFLNKWLKHGGLYVKVLRLFRKTCTEYIEAGHVEYAAVEGNVGVLRHDMLHDDSKGLHRWIAKHVKIAGREARRVVERRASHIESKDREVEGITRIRIQKLIWDRLPLRLQPILFFIYTYVIKIGILDGKEGFIYYSLWAYWYRTLIHSKVKELQRCLVDVES